DRQRVVVGGGERERAVLGDDRGIELADGDAQRTDAAAEVDIAGGEATGAVIQQDRCGGAATIDGAEIGNHDVEIAVVVEIAEGGVLAGNIGGHHDRRGEAAVAVVRQHPDVAVQVVEIDHDDVGLAVAGGIADGQRAGSMAAQELCGAGAESAIAVADEHADIVAVIMGGHGIEIAVAVEVAKRNAIGTEAAAEAGEAGAEAAVAVAEQYGDVV